MKATRLLLVAGLLACGDRAPTGVNPKAHEPIDPRMPNLPPA